MQAQKSSIELTKRDDLYLRYKIIKQVLKPLRPRLAGPGKPLPANSPKLKSPKVKCPIKEHKYADMWCYEYQPQSTSEAPKDQLYYFCGGGFQSSPSKSHWKTLAKVAVDLSDTYIITLVSYPLAPRSTSEASLPMLHEWLSAVCSDAVNEGRHITLAGDSAGGNITLSLGIWWAQQLENGRDINPIRDLLVISPATDLRNSNPRIKDTAPSDPLLDPKVTQQVADAWSSETYPATDPIISPILADLSILKAAGIKVDGVVGTADVLAPDAIAFREQCSKYGVSGEWLQWEGQMHCFPLTGIYGVREGMDALKWIVDVLRRNARQNRRHMGHDLTPTA